MATTPVYGWQGKLGIDTSWPVTKRYNFESATFALDEEFVDNNGIRGTVARSGELVSPGKRRCQGQIVIHPTALELAAILEWAMGGTPTGSGTVTYPLSETHAADANGIFGRPTRYIALDTVSKVHSFDSVAVDKLTIRGSGDGEQKLEVILDLIGIDETSPLGAAGTFPSLNIDTTTYPFMFNQLVMVANGHTYVCKDYEGTWDFAIDKERFFNSITLTALCMTDRHVRVNFNIGWGDGFADYGLGVAGAAVTATFTYGGGTLAIAYNNVKFPRKGPTFQGRGMEIMQRMEGISYKTGTSNLETVTTLNQGP